MCKGTAQVSLDSEAVQAELSDPFSYILISVLQNVQDPGPVMTIINPFYLDPRKRVIGKQGRPRSDATLCGVWRLITVYIAC